MEGAVSLPASQATSFVEVGAVSLPANQATNLVGPKVAAPVAHTLGVWFSLQVASPANLCGVLFLRQKVGVSSD